MDQNDFIEERKKDIKQIELTMREINKNSEKIKEVLDIVNKRL